MGLKEHFIGMDYMACAVILAHRDNYYLEKVYERMMPAIAKRFEGSTIDDVAGGLIQVRDLLWEQEDRDLLGSMSRFKLIIKPTTGELAVMIRDYKEKKKLLDAIDLYGMKL